MKLSSLFSVAALLLTAVLSPSQINLRAAEAASHFEIPATDEGLPGAGPIRRYDWFRKLWQQRRAAWAERATQDQGAVVFLGDSITQGWGDEMGGKFAGM